MSVENDEEPSNAEPAKTPTLKKVSAYQALKRNLSEEELTSPGTLKLMLNDIDRLNEEIEKLEKFRDQFYACDKDRAILTEKLNTNTAKEILYSVTITLGAILIGVGPSIWVLSSIYGVIDVLSGIVLLIGGFASKFRK
ncbi:hypothetical protein [Mucilaginibacter endophyticus]|uniref:hypothetical protein n=1 Tax=Mucilaginibacter endophyticus TaxID=2675003 RepID=UPI000E0DDB22|nr:hypothetical protein [Mucilaginibacter endophyticus]